MPISTLPIESLRGALVDALSAHQVTIVRAPTGSGKSTQVPQMLLDEGVVPAGQRVLVLQPRRLAARLLARRVAQERDGKLGDEVGYQIRFDRQWGPATRLLFITEGTLPQMVLGDPRLPGVGAVVFDEFHERHLDGDLGLALATQLQQTIRPDLKLLVMSATLDTSLLTDYLNGPPVLEAEGRTFPIEIRYGGNAGGDGPPVWEAAAKAFRSLFQQQPDGDFLVFMPGSYEIQRTVEEIMATPEGRQCVVLPLHGELPPEKQDAAVNRYDARKVVVSTNVAETSLTIDGIRLVIDSGLARVARFDPHRGINTLLIEKISQASTDQRAGRAGRTAPGICLRLWTEKDQAHRPRHDVPEIHRVDLAETLLQLKRIEERLAAFA